MKKYILMICLILVALVLVSTNVYGILHGNDIKDAFPAAAQKELNVYLVSGASQFLLSESNAMALLNEYEISDTGFNIQASLDSAKKALSYIDASITGFQNAKNLGLKTGVESQKAVVLKSISYDTIVSGMNTVIAGKLLTFFKSGDVIGIYTENINNLSKIKETLTSIIGTLEQGKKPGIEIYWKLYQQYAETMLFGNYATVIGRTVFDQ